MVTSYLPPQPRYSPKACQENSNSVAFRIRILLRAHGTKQKRVSMILLAFGMDLPVYGQLTKNGPLLLHDGSQFPRPSSARRTECKQLATRLDALDCAGHLLVGGSWRASTMLRCIKNHAFLDFISTRSLCMRIMYQPSEA